MIVALACFYIMAMFYFVIAFLVDWIRLRVHVRKYLKYGVAVGVIVVGVAVLRLAMTPTTATHGPVVYFFGCAVSFLKMTGFTTLGMYYCYRIGRPSFPLCLRYFPVAEAPERNSTLPPVPDVTPLPIVVGDVNPDVSAAPLPAAIIPPESSVENAEVVPPTAPDPIELPDISLPAAPQAWAESAPGQTMPADDRGANPDIRPLPVPQVRASGVLLSALMVTGISVLYTVCLFAVTSPRVSETARRAFGLDSMESARTITVSAALFVLLAAFAEEIVFRLGIQSFLARYLKLGRNRYWIAIVITTAIWTLAHVGTLEPLWVKPAQVFPMGLLLGWLCQRYGVESSILAHMLFNGALLFLSRQWLT